MFPPKDFLTEKRIDPEDIPRLLQEKNKTSVILGLGEGQSPVAGFVSENEALKISVDALYERQRNYLERFQDKFQARMTKKDDWYLLGSNIEDLNLPEGINVSAIVCFFPDNEWQFLKSIQEKYPQSYFLIITPKYTKQYYKRLNLKDKSLQTMDENIFHSLQKNNVKTTIRHISLQEYSDQFPETVWSKIIMETDSSDLVDLAVIEVNPEKSVSFTSVN